MKYTRPEVIAIRSAITAIQSTEPAGSKRGTDISDGQGAGMYFTDTAYEADE